MTDLLAGLSSYKDECFDAAHALDARRQEHERRFRRYRIVQRPATREAMIERIKAVGPTDLTGDPEFFHAPVVPVAGGVAFDPDRMTLSTLEDVYNRLRGIRAVDGRVQDRVSQVLSAYPNGLREKEIIELTGASRTAVKRALFLLVANEEASARLEPTRGAGSARKRFFPANAEFSLDPLVDAEVI